MFKITDDLYLEYVEGFCVEDGDLNVIAGDRQYRAFGDPYEIIENYLEQEKKDRAEWDKRIFEKATPTGGRRCVGEDPLDEGDSETYS